MREIPVRATTAEEEAVGFQKSWHDEIRENDRLRAENERLKEALREADTYIDRFSRISGVLTPAGEDMLATIRAAQQEQG